MTNLPRYTYDIFTETINDSIGLELHYAPDLKSILLDLLGSKMSLEKIIHILKKSLKLNWEAACALVRKALGRDIPEDTDAALAALEREPEKSFGFEL